MTDVFEHKGRYYHISEASRIHKEEELSMLFDTLQHKYDIIEELAKGGAIADKVKEVLECQ
jgi:hypothetical protein